MATQHTGSGSRRHRSLLIGVGIAVLAHVAAAAWFWAVYPSLPDSVVTHWGPSGPDAFTPKSQAGWMLLVTLAISVVAGVALTQAMPRNSPSQAVATGFTAGLGVFLAGLMGGTLAGQAGRTMEDPAALNPLWIAAALAVAVVAGLIAVRLLGPAPARPAASGVPATSARLPTGEPLVPWSTTLRSHPALLLVLLLPVAAVVIVGLSTRDWILPALVGIVAILLVVGLHGWKLAVDPTGFTARGWLGWPSLHLPLREIERAEALAQVHALQYGGTGLRSTRDGERLVLRGGPALRIELSDGTDFIVTTPDADHAVRLLNSYVAAARGPLS